MTRMAQIIKFQPRASEARDVFEEYIQAAKSLPFIEPAEFEWDNDRWDLEGLAKRERPNRPAVLNLSSFPAGTPVGDFIRAFICFKIAGEFGVKRQVGKFSKPLSSYKFIVRAMEGAGLSHPSDITPEVLDASVELLRADAGPKATAYGVDQRVKCLRWIADALNEARLTEVVFDWDTEVSATTRYQSRVNKGGSEKSLSEDELGAIIEAFDKAQTPTQQVVAGMLALLCCAPMRIQEMLELPVDCDVYLDPGDGYQAGLRWFPKKGGMPDVKFVPKAMVPVAKKALAMIKANTELARRRAAEAIETNAVEANDKRYPHWPLLTEDKRVRIDEALFCGFGDYHSFRFKIQGESSIFRELGIRLNDGSFPEIASHSPRHYLNTIANRASVPQADIARWSGRKNFHQNSTYDHETPEELLARIKAARGNKKLPVPKVFDQAEFDVAIIKETAHTTPFGWCLQSLRQSPCNMFGACLNCTSLACVKGADGKRENIQAELDKTSVLRDLALKRINGGLGANPKWIEQLEQKIERLTQLLDVLADPDVENGSFVLMSDVTTLPQYDPTEDAKRLIKQQKRLKDEDDHEED